MKKIVTVITLMLAFTISANAQDKKNSLAKADTKEVVVLSPAQAGRQDAIAIKEFLGLDNKQEENFTSLFRMKHEVMQDPAASIERKNEMSRIVGLKIEASINPEQLEKLRTNTALFKQLKSENTLSVKKSK